MRHATHSTLHESVFGGPAAQAALAKSLAEINRDYAPVLHHFNEEISKILEPFHREMRRHLDATLKLPVSQMVDTAAVMAPFKEMMDKQAAETIRNLAQTTTSLQFQLPTIKSPIHPDLLRQLTELAAFAAPLLPETLAESVEQASLQVTTARPRTPEEIIAYINLCITVLTFLITVIQVCATTNAEKPSEGDTINIVINNPTTVTNVTTVIQPPPAAPAPDSPK